MTEHRLTIPVPYRSGRHALPRFGRLPLLQEVGVWPRELVGLGKEV
jgi:hypothetical protein